MSPKTVKERTAIVEDADNSLSAAICAENAMDVTTTLISIDASDIDQGPALDVVDELPADAPINCDPEQCAAPRADVDGVSEHATDVVDSANELSDSEPPLALPGGVTHEAICADETDAAATDAQKADFQVLSIPAVDAHDETVIVAVEPSGPALVAPETPTSFLPDPTSISERLKNLVVAVSQVEELSRHAREVAATDKALYDGIAASQRQFEDGLAEARHIGQEAQAVYGRAFGREARAVAEPAVAEAREVEQAFEELTKRLAKTGRHVSRGAPGRRNPSYRAAAA